MSTELKNNDPLVIQAANDGDFMVKHMGLRNEIWEVLFAGNLAQCLQYQWDHFYGKGDGNVVVHDTRD